MCYLKRREISDLFGFKELTQEQLSFKNNIENKLLSIEFIVKDIKESLIRN